MDIGLSNLQVPVIYFKIHHFLRGSKPSGSFVILSSFKVLLCWAEYKVTLNLRHTTHRPAHVLSRAEKKTNYGKINSKRSDLPQPMGVHAGSSSAHAVLPASPHHFQPSTRCYVGNFCCLHNLVIRFGLASSFSCFSIVGRTYTNSHSVPTFQVTLCPHPIRQ